MQFSEGLSVRQAAEAVRARIDWKYALGLRLSDPGFDFSVLSEFRSRLVAEVLSICCSNRFLRRARSAVTSRCVAGNAGSSTQRLGNKGATVETMRAALNALGAAEPEWMREHADSEWFERYGRRIEDQRLPKGK
jgi:transposase